MEMILLLVVFAGLIFFMFRSNRKRQRQQAELQASLKPGTEVMTSAGIYGTITRVDSEENKVWLESTPGTTVVIHPQAIGRVITAPEDTEPEADATEAITAKDTDTDSATTASAATAAPTGEPAFGERVDEPVETTDTDAETTAASDSDSESPKA